jgi:hypothetical protein
MKRTALAVLIGLWGASVMAALQPGYIDLAMIAAAGIGAFVIGLVAAPLFERRGAGWRLGAAVLTTLGGAAVAGGLFSVTGAGLNPLEGAMLGTVVVVEGLVLHWPAALIWALGAFGVHLAAGRLGSMPTR